MKYCPNCGNELLANSNFCDRCGFSKNSINNKSNSNKKNGVWLALIASIIMAGIACFLPFFQVFFISINFVYNFGEFADGIIIVVLELIALICVLCKLRIIVFILQLLSTGVFFYTFVNLFKSIGSNMQFSIEILGVGFYLLIISLLLAFILSLIRVVNKKDYV